MGGRRSADEYRSVKRLSPWRARAAVTIAVTLAGIWPQPAPAQVPIINVPATADTVDAITQLSAEIQKLSAMAATMSQVLNVQHDISAALGFLGFGNPDTGLGSLGSLIQAGRMGMSALQEARGQFETISAEIHNLTTDPLGSFSILTMFNILGGALGLPPSVGTMNQGVNLTQITNMLRGGASAPNAITIIQQTLYTPYGSATADQIEAVNGARRAIEQQATIQGIAAASGTTQTQTSGNDALQQLSIGVTNATNERGDIKANSAALMKVLEQATAQNGLLGRFLYVRSTAMIGMQEPYGPTAGSAIP